MRHQIQALEAQAKQTRFRKEIDIRTELCAVIELPRIEPPLSLNQGNQQHLISAAFGGPSEVRDLVGSP
jgi:hypothetical protein